MPEGVQTVVEEGFATIEFTDPAKKGPGLAALLEHTPPELIDKVTRPRVAYTVPEDNARAAGLLHDVDLSNAAGPLVLTPNEGETPDDTWKVDELKAYADKHSIDLDGATKKADILAAINNSRDVSAT